MLMKKEVSAHWKRRKGSDRFKVGNYERIARKKNVRVRILKKPIKLYPRVDLYGRRKGFSSKPPRTYKELI